MDARLSYEQLKKRLDESCKQEDARQRAIRRKRDERRAIKKGGGGHFIARRILPEPRADEDTDFNFGANVPGSGLSTKEESTTETADGCMGRVECRVCKKFHGYCREVSEEKEKLKMLPSGDEQQGNNRGGRRGGLDFINAQELTSTGQEAKILMVKYNAESKGISLKLAFQAKIKFLYVKANKNTDPNYKLLYETFGPDENNWVDQRILLSAKQDPFTDAFKTHVEIVERKGARR